MGIVKTGVSAIGKLLIVVGLAGAFLVGVIGVVYLSLRGNQVTVPEIVGKDYIASENEIAALGLKLKKRATRYSQEKPNTVLEQLPKAGETVKTGQTISVVTSEANPEGGEAPAALKKETSDQEDQSTDVTPDKPVKTNKNTNTNTKKPSQTTRDVISNKSNKNTNSNSAGDENLNGNSNNTNSKSNSNTGKNNSATPGNKSVPPSNSNKTDSPKPNQTKPIANKTPATSGETRTRKVP